MIDRVTSCCGADYEWGVHIAVYAEKAAIVVGSEGNGVCAAWRAPDLARVSIPMLGQADSLNVAASAAILLFEAQARLGEQVS